MKRAIRWIHLVLSLPAGLIITLICFSGAALVFEEEIMRGCFPSRYYAEEVKGSPLPLGELMEKASSQLPDTMRLTGVMMPANVKENYRLSFAGQGRMQSIFVDPYSGQVREIYNAEGNFFSLMRRLHRWLLTGFKADGGFPVGKTIVGIATLLLVFILLSGMTLWAIKWRKSKRRARAFSIKWTSGRKRLFYDLHVAGGIYASVVLLVIALTGLTWSFSWYSKGVYRLFGAEIAQQPPHQQQQGNRGGGGGGGNRGGGGGPREGRKEKTDYSAWQAVADQLRAQYPTYRMLSIQDGRASVSPHTTGNIRATDSYTFNPRTGEIAELSRYADLDRSMKLRGWLYSVHVGVWGGWLTRILSFLGALMGAILPLTGYYLLSKRFI